MKWRKGAKEGTIVAGGNGHGENLNQLSTPHGVIVDDLGQIYIADRENHRIMRWCEGKEEGEIVVGGNGTGNQSNQMNFPTGLSLDEEGNLMKSYPIIENVTLSYSNITNEIYPLIKSIRSDWTSSNTHLVTFTEGLTNIILGIFDNRTPDDDSNALIIKIYGIQTELFIDRQAEINVMIKFHEHGVLSQRVLIQFNNGIIYEFASGKTCSRDDVREENISKLIAIKLTEIHNIPVQETEQPYIMLILRQFLKLLDKNSFDLSSIISDIDKIEEHILSRLIPNPKYGKDLVLCHNDLLVKNIV
ncbi:unnamed protein product [Adineta steineri]|uniref:ethanolamine kinase n=2 Tax=Adineta steineri TaxID=433720 RepID=A0A813SGY5_9BILA|nr:unnamed protein product [Adineta steineri]